MQAKAVQRLKVFAQEPIYWPRLVTNALRAITFTIGSFVLMTAILAGVLKTDLSIVTTWARVAAEMCKSETEHSRSCADPSFWAGFNFGIWLLTIMGTGLMAQFVYMWRDKPEKGKPE